MRKRFGKERVVAWALATTLALSVVNVPAVSNWRVPMTTVQAATIETAVYEGGATPTLMYEDVAMDVTSTWDDLGMVTFSAAGTDGLLDGAKLTADILLPLESDEDVADFDGLLKVQGVVKLGADWTWTECPTIPELNASDFETVTIDDKVYAKATVSFDFAAGDAVQEIIMKIAGYQCNYSGDIYHANVKLANTVEVDDPAEYDELEPAFAGCAFVSGNTWLEHTTDGQATEHTTNIDLGEVPNPGSKMTADVLIKGDAAPEFAGEIKFKCVMRLGDNWNWVQSTAFPAVTSTSFAQVQDSEWYKASIECEFGDTVDAWYGDYQGGNAFTDVVTEELKALTLNCIGSSSDFAGDIYVTNVEFENAEKEIVLTPQDPTVVADFATDIDGWASEAGWDYSHGNADARADGATPAESAEVIWDEASQSLKLDVDYSQDLSSGWSETKATGIFEEVNLSNYNMVSFSLTYPSDMESVRTKLFMKATDNTTVLDGEASFRTKTVEDLGNGWSKATVRGTFTPADVNVSSLTIGIIGPYAALDYVLIDDVKIAQVDASEDYVKITATPTDSPAQADLTNMASDVKLVDANATDSTKALAAYLKGLQASDQVLFGHQNSTFRSVRTNGEISDIKDITGSEAGLFGIDSLALTGVESSATTRAEAIQNSVDASVKAAEGGSIVTLSCHMPNFANAKVKQNEDGSYDFTTCDFGESKDLTPCADYVLEGGKYNAAFNAYLDIIAEYAKELDEVGIPVLFRPFHENSGNWFWWGTSTSEESYKAMWRYMVNYMEEKGVNNFLYVYSPNGPFSTAEQYLDRYPGDEYVDVIAFDYYDDYADVNVYTGDKFFDALATTCDVVAEIAEEKGKIPAIAETGIRMTGAGKDSLMVTGNPTTGKDWYNQVIDTASEHDIPYFLLWANFDSANFFVPYKYNNELGHEMINEFIESYNNEKSIFGNGTNFYDVDGAVSKGPDVENDGYDVATGYMISPKDYAVIKTVEDATMQATVLNVDKVIFKVYASEDATPIEVEGTKDADSNLYTATLTAEQLAALGETSVGVIEVVADDVVIGKASFINFNKDADVMPKEVFDNFEFYYGSDGLLQSKYGSANSAANCNATVTLDSEHKSAGDYGMAFNYTLAYKGSEVWTGGLGREFEDTDFSNYNALSMWVDPDGYGQKMVIQLVDAEGSEYEYFLTDKMKTDEAKTITIPFTSFIKKGTTDVSVNPSSIAAYRIWCNSIPDNYTGNKDDDGYYTVASTVYFDEIKVVNADIDDGDDVDQTAANAVVEMINSIGTVDASDACKEKIEAARVAYNLLTEEQKALVSKDALKVLTEAEESYAELKQAETDKMTEEKKKTEDAKQAQAVKDKIAAIGTVDGSDECKARIEAAKVAYDALTEDQKALISADELKILTDAEKKNQEMAKAALVGKTVKAKDGSATYKITAVKGDTVEVSYKKPTKKKASVTIPATVTLENGTVAKVTSIAAKAFKKNTKLKNVTIGKNVKSIGKEAFSGCSKLTTVKKANNITTIGVKAFYKCTSLKKITIPSKVNKIGKQAFYGCKNLKSITIKTTKLTKSKVGKNAFKGISSKATIKVPKSKYKAYKSLLKSRGVGSKVKIKK